MFAFLLAVKELEALGADSARSPAAVAATGMKRSQDTGTHTHTHVLSHHSVCRIGADIIVTMLPSSPHVRSVYTGDDGVLVRLQTSGGSRCAQLTPDNATEHCCKGNAADRHVDD